MEPQVDITQRFPESRSDGTVLNTMTIQSAVALRLTPSPANQPGVPLDDSLHPRLLTAVAFATLELGSRPKKGTQTNSHRWDTLLTVAAYIDLNPVAANVAPLPESSTSGPIELPATRFSR